MWLLSPWRSEEAPVLEAREGSLSGMADVAKNPPSVTEGSVELEEELGPDPKCLEEQTTEACLRIPEGDPNVTEESGREEAHIRGRGFG